MAMDAVRAAFAACGDDVFNAFAAHVEREVGAFDAMRGLDEGDLRAAVAEFFEGYAKGAEAPQVSALRRGKCAAELVRWAAAPTPAPAATTTRQELRRRGAGGDASAATLPEDGEDKPKPAPTAGAVRPKQRPPPPAARPLSDHEQLVLEIVKGVLTLLLFMLLNYLYRTYLNPPFQPKEVNVEEIVRKLQKEGSVTEYVQGRGEMP